VLTVLALGDELSFWVFPKGSKAGTFRSMRPRRSSSADSRASSIVPVSVHAPQLITPKVARIQRNLADPRRKARHGRSRAGQEGGVCCYWLIR
jgi:hypothetical protein